MDEHIRWRELMRCDDDRLARIVTLSIASMEFDVRCTHVEDPLAGRRIQEIDPYLIEVRDEDWHDLSTVLNELIEEQLEFDTYLEHRDRAVGRHQRRVLLILAIVVGTLAAAGAIEL